MFKLFSLRCGGVYETGFALVFPPPRPGIYAQRVHPKLTRRIMRFVNCPGMMAGRGHLFDNWKSNTTHYFVETGRSRLTKLPDEIKPSWKFIPGSQQCWYLGKFPVYWNHQLNQVSYAHNMGPGLVFALTGGPFVPGVDIAWIRAVSPETRAFHLTPEQLKAYNGQEATLAYRKKWHEDCKARYYARDKPNKQRTVYTPLGPAPWEGKPMRELALPRPDAPPTPEAPVEPGVIPAVTPPLRATFEFSLVGETFTFTIFL